MDIPTSELGTPDEALIRRFNDFVAQNVGNCLLKSCQIEFAVFSPDNPQEIEHEITMVEEIQAANGTNYIHTSYSSHEGIITKIIQGETPDERKANDKAKRRVELEVEEEKALTGEEDNIKALDSLYARKFQDPEFLESLLERVINRSEQTSESVPVGAMEVDGLLDELDLIKRLNPKTSK